VTGPLQHDDEVLFVAFSPDSTRVAAAAACTVTIWDASSGEVVAGPFNAHAAHITTVAFSPDSAYIISGTSDGPIHIWDAQNGEVAAGPLEGHTGHISSTVFSSGGTCIISGSQDHTIRIWDVWNEGRAVGVLEGHTDSVCSVAISSDSTRIVSGSLDHTIRIWDMCPRNLDNSNPLEDWELSSDGWVTTRDARRLLWVPADLRTCRDPLSLCSVAIPYVVATLIVVL
jgi:WD40 repeat protein